LLTGKTNDNKTVVTYGYDLAGLMNTRTWAHRVATVASGEEFAYYGHGIRTANNGQGNMPNDLNPYTFVGGATLTDDADGKRTLVFDGEYRLIPPPGLTLTYHYPPPRHPLILRTQTPILQEPQQGAAVL